MQFDDLVLCPFNSDHRISKTDLPKHLKRCKDQPDPKRAQPQQPEVGVEETKVVVPEIVSPYSAKFNIDPDLLKTIAPPPGFASPKKTPIVFETEEPIKPVILEPKPAPIELKPTSTEPKKPASVAKAAPPPVPKDDEWVTASKKAKVKPKQAQPSDMVPSASRSGHSTLAELQLGPEISKRKKAIKKKLKDIKELEDRRTRGEKLDTQQQSKLNSKRSLEQELRQLST